MGLPEDQKPIRGLWLRVVVVVVIVFGGFVYFTQVHNLIEDQRVVDAIRADPRVDYAYIELGGITPQSNFYNPTLYPDYPHLQGYWVRFFYAWEYPQDSIPLSENMKIFGLIDGNLDITIIVRMPGNGVFY
ncbi:MAG: hypothetical protein Q8O47_09615 [Candidatus Bathyarchaeota archaeon]|nr:hypothetical protein [Candidatus Bathyarchaeota archaeon]